MLIPHLSYFPLPAQVLLLLCWPSNQRTRTEPLIGATCLTTHPGYICTCKIKGQQEKIRMKITLSFKRLSILWLTAKHMHTPTATQEINTWGRVFQWGSCTDLECDRDTPDARDSLSRPEQRGSMWSYIYRTVSHHQAAAQMPHALLQ